jgi:hypothetical protein
MKNLLSVLSAQVIKDFFGMVDVIAVVEAGIHDGNQVAHGRIGVIEVIELGLPIGW